jgi:hypothetical protein
MVGRFRAKNLSLAGWRGQLVWKESISDAEDPAALAGGRNGTGGVPAEKTVAEAGDDGVAKFAKGTGEQDKEFAEAAPGRAEELECLSYGVGAGVEALGWTEGASDQDDAVGGVRRG